MKTANIRNIPALVAVELAHGFEAVPTTVRGLPLRYVTVDDDGGLQVWSSPLPPEYGGGVWSADTEQVEYLGDVNAGGVYQHAADSLRRLDYSGLGQ